MTKAFMNILHNVMALIRRNRRQASKIEAKNVDSEGLSQRPPPH
jgi:hypothetical protein